MHPPPVSLSFPRRGKEGMFIRRPNPERREGSPEQCAYYSADSSQARNDDIQLPVQIPTPA